MNKTYLLALAVLAMMPVTNAATFSDASNDALLNRASLEILSVSVDGDGSDLVTVFQLDDIQANQPATRYSFHINDQNGLEIGVDCHLGAGVLVASQTCSAVHEVFSPGGGVAQVEPIACNWTFDLTADTIQVNVPYTEFSAVSGDIVYAILGASARMVDNHGLIVGDSIDADAYVTLA